MNLIIDVGNTRAKVAFFLENTLIEKKIVLEEALTLAFLQEIITEKKVERAILSTTGIVSEDVLAFLQTKENFIYLDAETPIPITNAYATPKTLGKDRLAAAAAAQMLFPNQHCLVIDCGTCTTYNFLTKEGVFLGGNITPGVTMRFQAMHTFTAKLPLLEKKEVDVFVGDSTENAMQTGVQLGAVYEMNGFIDAYIQRFGEIQTLLTGGNKDFFEKHLGKDVEKRSKKQIFADENLVLKGLNYILNYNIYIKS